MEMKDQLVQSLTDSVLETFTTLVSLTPRVKVREYDFNVPLDNKVIVSLGLTGKVDSSLMLLFSEESACKLISKMLSAPFNKVNQEIMDGVAEVTNIIAGGLKVRLVGLHYDFDISIPTVVFGGDKAQVAKLEGNEVIVLDVDCGELRVDLIMFYTVRSEMSRRFSLKSSNEDAGTSLRDLIKE